jgi:NAD(P)-dependent dehydrogenase (short-subunit alcohol dehydrogenase family)
MMKQKDGVIVNIASLAGLKNIPPVPPSYTASKFAVIGITKAIAQEFGPYNINCNAVCPGTVDTDMRSIALENISKENGITIEEADLEEISMVSLGRAGKPEEIASLVTYLASPQSRYITGAAIPIDGGITFGL